VNLLPRLAALVWLTLCAAVFALVLAFFLPLFLADVFSGRARDWRDHDG
jgi:hypothetical protein